MLGFAQDGLECGLETSAGSIVADQVVVSAGARSPPLLGASFERLLKVSRQLLHWYELDDPGAYDAAAPVYIWMNASIDNDYFYGFPPFPGYPRVKAAAEQYETTTPADAADRRVTRRSRWE